MERLVFRGFRLASVLRGYVGFGFLAGRDGGGLARREAEEEVMAETLQERLRDGISGPYKAGRPYLCSVYLNPKDVLDAADALDAKDAEIARLTAERDAAWNEAIEAAWYAAIKACGHDDNIFTAIRELKREDTPCAPI